jgi:hypothetical protein
MMRGKGYLFKWYVALFLVFLYAPAILLPVFAFNDSSGGLNNLWRSGRAGLDPLCLSRSALHHGFHHAAHGAA